MGRPWLYVINIWKGFQGLCTLFSLLGLFQRAAFRWERQTSSGSHWCPKNRQQDDSKLPSKQKLSESWLWISGVHLEDGQDATVSEVALVRVVLGVSHTSEDLESFADTNPASLWAEHLDHGGLEGTVGDSWPVHHPSGQVGHALHHKGIQSHHCKLLLRQQTNTNRLLASAATGREAPRAASVPGSYRTRTSSCWTASWWPRIQRTTLQKSAQTNQSEDLWQSWCLRLFTDQLLYHSSRAAAHTEPPRVQDVHGNLATQRQKSANSSSTVHSETPHLWLLPWNHLLLRQSRSPQAPGRYRRTLHRLRREQIPQWREYQGVHLENRSPQPYCWSPGCPVCPQACRWWRPRKPSPQ